MYTFLILVGTKNKVMECGSLPRGVDYVPRYDHVLSHSHNRCIYTQRNRRQHSGKLCAKVIFNLKHNRNFHFTTTTNIYMSANEYLFDERVIFVATDFNPSIHIQ